MRVSPLVSGVAALVLASVLILCGCQSNQPGSGTGSGGSHATPHPTRVPVGANTRHAAALAFFNAYRTHDRQAAKEVATDAAINALPFNPGSGTNPTLQLVDDSHIYYEGGSIELRFARTAAGRWYVQSVTSHAD